MSQEHRRTGAESTFIYSRKRHQVCFCRTCAVCAAKVHLGKTWFSGWSLPPPPGWISARIVAGRVMIIRPSHWSHDRLLKHAGSSKRELSAHNMESTKE